MFMMTKAVSGKKHINRENIENAMHKYSVEFCLALQKLYDLGFTSSPFSIDDIDFRIAVQQEYPDELRLMRSPLTGRTEFNENTLLYAEFASENEEFVKVAHEYRKLIIARSNLYKCETLLKEIPFRLKGTAYLTVKVVVSEGIIDRTKYPLIPEALLADGNKYVWEYSIGGAILYTICKEVGISDETIREYKKADKPFFLTGVTGEQEELLADTLLRGYIPLDGDFGGKLRDIMVEYYSTYFSENAMTSTVQLPFESYIYNKSVEVYCTVIEGIRKNMHELGMKELYITTDKIYFQGTRPQRSDYKPYYRNLHVGMYANIDTVDIFEGIQGVFYDSGDGIPMFLTDYGLVYAYPYDDFHEQDKEKVFRLKYVHSDDEMRFYISRKVKDPLTQELVMALFLARCGETEYIMLGNYPSSNVDAFRNSSEEAIHIARDKINLL